ncbi:MAG: hypothetical protein QNJ44_15685 [Rhodobacter sp.]|nr:hypothetical protein [Rhodobacter sp.]
MADPTGKKPTPAEGTGARFSPDGETLELTRTAVRGILQRSESFRVLPADKRRLIAEQMVRVGSYMANPGGVLSEASRQAPPARPYAHTLAWNARSTLERAGSDQGSSVKGFEDVAIHPDAVQFGELVGSVDFPGFVGSLIQGVFNAIVDSSIQQMEAYAEMLKGVSQSVDDFASDNISDDKARDWLVEAYPDLFELTLENGDTGTGESCAEAAMPARRLVVKDMGIEARLRAVSHALGLERELTDIRTPESEAALIRGARVTIATGRMQLLASMVLMGIHRIVMTDQASEPG